MVFRETTESTLVSGDSEDGVSSKPVGQKTDGAQSIPGQDLGRWMGICKGPK